MSCVNNTKKGKALGMLIINLIRSYSLRIKHP